MRVSFRPKKSSWLSPDVKHQLCTYFGSTENKLSKMIFISTKHIRKISASSQNLTSTSHAIFSRCFKCSCLWILITISCFSIHTSNEQHDWSVHFSKNPVTDVRKVLAWARSHGSNIWNFAVLLKLFQTHTCLITLTKWSTDVNVCHQLFRSQRYFKKINI